MFQMLAHNCFYLSSIFHPYTTYKKSSTAKSARRDQHRRKQTISQRIRHSSYDVGDTHHRNNSMAFFPIIPSNCLQRVEHGNTRNVPDAIAKPMAKPKLTSADHCKRSPLPNMPIGVCTHKDQLEKEILST